MKLFLESGMDSVSMHEIARESGLPIATVYQYFPNKQSIVRQIWESHTFAVETLLQTELATLLENRPSQTVQRVIVGGNPGADESAVANYALIATEAASSTAQLGQQISRRNSTPL